MSIHIYNYSDENLTFNLPYQAKLCLKESVTQTHQGFALIGKYQFLAGCSAVLSARVKAIEAIFRLILPNLAFGISSFILLGYTVCAIPLNLCSRIPGISSFQSVKDYTSYSNNVIYRTARVHLIAIPTISLFLIASTISLFLPGILTTENILFRTIHLTVAPLGPLKTIIAKIKDAFVVKHIASLPSSNTPLRDYSFQGWSNILDYRPDLLDQAEEYLRTLSYKNTLEEKEFDYIDRHTIK